MQIEYIGEQIKLIFEKETEIDNSAWSDQVSESDFGKVRKLEIQCATTIKSGAFEGLYMLSEVILPETLETIEASAFAQGDNAAAFLTIKIPRSVKKIEYQAFNRSQLTLQVNPLDWVQIEFGSYIGGAWSYQIKPAGTEMQDYNGVSLENLVLICPRISAGAFYSCNKIKTIVTNADIEQQAFKNCDELTTILFAGRHLGEEAFSMCPKLSEAALTHSLSSIGDRVFYRSTAGNEVKYYTPLLVVYQGSKEQFLAVKRGKGLFQNREQIKILEFVSGASNKYALACFNEQLILTSSNSPEIYLVNNGENYSYSQTYDNFKLDLTINDEGVITWTPENGQLITLDTAQNKRWTKYTGNSCINLAGSDTIYTNAIHYERYWYY